MKVIRFGIIGTGSITKRFIKGAMCVEHVEVCAVLSRDIMKAKSYASAYPNMQAYDDLTMFLSNPQVDAIYIATPNATHKNYILEALKYHKHVLCEKPMLLHERDVHECFAFAKSQKCVLMEAMKPCFLPTTIQVKKWLEEGRIGTLRYIEAGYCSNGIEPFLSGWHAERTQGGGALYDLGVYPIGFVNHIESSSITKVQATSRFLSNGVDAMSILQVTYEDGVLAHLTCAIDTPMDNKAILYGDLGCIQVQNFWKSDTAELSVGGEVERFSEPHHQSEFQYQIASFVTTIRLEEIENSIMSEQASARNAWMIDQVLEKEE